MTGDVTKDVLLRFDTYVKLRHAHWLEYICFDPQVDTFYEQESLHLKQDNSIDALLQSSLDFLDVNDASAVNKVLDDASVMHAHKA